MVLQKIKEPSKEGTRGQPFQKSPLFRGTGNRERGIFNNNTLQEDKEEVRMNLLIAPCIQLNGPSVWISILQYTSSEFISGKNRATVPSRYSETFCKEFIKTDKRNYETGYSKRLRNLFYFALKAINATKIVSINQRSVRPSGSGGPGHVEERFYSSFGSQRGPISQLFVSCEKERWRELLSSQPKGPEQKYSVSALQDERVVPIKGNVVTKKQNLQDRPEGCILFNPPFQ